MENENIENESIEVESVNENTNIETGVEDISIYDVEEFEQVPEKVTLEETGEAALIEEGTEGSDESMDIMEPEEEFEELIKEYLKTKLDTTEEVDIEEDEVIDGSEKGILATNETSDIDYTQYLIDIRYSSARTYEVLHDIQEVIDDYMDNNTLNSPVSDISLTNALLIVIFITLLFNGVLSFARRIF